MTSKPKLRWCFHGSAVVRSYDDAIAWLARVFGASVLEYSDLTDEPLIGRRGGCNWIGDAALELVEPTRPDSAGAQFLERFGTGMYGIALDVDDLKNAEAWFNEKAVRFVGSAEDSLPILFTTPKEMDGLHIEWVAGTERDWDPHFGAPVPELSQAPLLEVERVAFFGTLARDPGALVAKLRELCDLEPIEVRPTGGASVAEAAVSLRDAVLLVYRLPADDSEMRSLWGPLLRKPRLHVMVLRVPDVQVAVARLKEAEGTRVLREDKEQGQVFLHPDDTHGMLIGLTDRDITGDPRQT
jgi:catechol 2,3-dioxygenase-like lactoylglutathione lyase family enzyme